MGRFLHFGLSALEDLVVGVAEGLFAGGADTIFAQFLQLLDALVLLLERSIQSTDFCFGVGALLAPLVQCVLQFGFGVGTGALCALKFRFSGL